MELSPHGGEIKQFFDNETLGYFTQVFNSFTPSKTEYQTISEVLCKKFNTSGETKREVQEVILPTNIRNLITDKLRTYFGRKARISSCSCWQDYSYYENNLHTDDADSVDLAAPWGGAACALFPSWLPPASKALPRSTCQPALETLDP